MKRWGFILTISLLTSCNTQDILIYSKNECFERQLTDLKNREVYKKTFASFLDTFKIVQSTSKTLLEEKADDGIFFKKDSLECLILVLERENDVTRGFGSAR